MKILVTGAGGFVGGHLIDVLLNNNVSVVAVDMFIRAELAERENVKAIQCNLDDVDNLPEMIDDRDIDCCIHLAWQGANGPARGDYDIQLNNIRRTLKLCETLPKLNIHRFVGIGTLAEKDTSNYIPTDGATPNAVAQYGVAKMSAQFMSKIVCTQLKIEHIWCQLSNLYGVGDSTNNFIKRAAFTPGEQMYDFVYITDIARGIFLAAVKGKSNTAYYIGSGNQRKLKYFISDIRDAIDPTIELHLGEVPFNGVCLPDEEFDCTKLQNDTGYKAEVPFSLGIRNTIGWLRENME